MVTIDSQATSVNIRCLIWSVFFYYFFIKFSLNTRKGTNFKETAGSPANHLHLMSKRPLAPALPLAARTPS